MSELTVERLFDNPPLTGTLPLQPKWSPDGSIVTFLRPAADDRERLDLWRLDVASGERSLWIDARELMGDESGLSDAEKAERERKRLFATGITSYAFSPDGERLLLPVDGVGHLYELDGRTLNAFTPAGTRQTDFRFSPKGHYVSYVRAGNLYVYDIEGGTERAITSDGGGTIANGIADFIAQEEMHRFEGHWWSADEQRLAFTRSDETPVEVSRRYEIDAETINVIEQRYP
ncbi:MAG: DPP IV N-terminal domain-containing protein, partial [Pseudomonadota bacterium]